MQTGTITVNPPAISSAVCSPNTVYATKYCAVYVYLNGKAGPAGVTVSLSSSNTSAAAVPGSLTIGQGATWGVVPVTSYPVDSSITVSFTATFNGGSQTATLAVNPPTLAQIIGSPRSIHLGGTTHVWVYLNAPAGPSGVTVTIGNGSSPSPLTMPGTLVIPPSATSGYVSATAIGGVDSASARTIVAGFGSSLVQCTVTVTPALASSVVVSPNSVGGQDGTTLYARLNGPARPSGVSVGLSSNDTPVASVPTSLSIAPGAWFGSAPVTTYAVVSSTEVILGASANGGTAHGTLVVVQYAVKSVVAGPLVTIGGQSGEQVTVYLNEPAGPSGGVVSLSSNNASAAMVPSTVAIPDGQSSGTAIVTTFPVGMNVPVALTGRIGSGPVQNGNLLVESAAGSPWPQGSGNVYNTGQGIGSGAVGEQSWSLSSDMQTYEAVIGSNGTIYLCEFASIEAVSPSGAVLWTFAPPGPFLGTLAVGGDGTIYVPNYDGLVAVNLDGTQKWALDFPNTNTDVLAIAIDGTIYCEGLDNATDVNALYAVNPNGSVKWIFDAPDDSVPTNNMAIGPTGVIYTAKTNGTDYTGRGLIAISASGSQLWINATNVVNITGSPAVGADGTIYVSDFRLGLIAINPNGTKKWAFNQGLPASGDAASASPSVGFDGTIYYSGYQGVFAGNGFGLVALNSDGSLKWTFETSSAFESGCHAAVGSDGVIYLCAPFNDGGDLLYAVNPDGSQKWLIQSPRFDGDPVNGADGTIYVLGAVSSLYAFH